MAVQVASLFGVLSLDDRNFRQNLQEARGGLSGFADRMRGVGDQVSDFGRGLTIATAPIAAIGFQGLRTAGNFEAAMLQIQARTGATGDEMQRISEFALQMGADTVFSGQQAADAFLQLLTSGQNVEQAISTLPQVLNLAAASGGDLGNTADVLTDIMAAFGLEVTDAAYVADSLARAAASSSADVGSLGQGFANVGGVARQFGLSVDETAAILAIFSENGIKGAEAGTQLRSMLLNMTRPTETVQAAWNQLGISFYDAEGNARPLTQVIADLDSRLSALPVSQQNELMTQLAGSYGIMGLSALRGSMSIGEMQETMQGQASAADVASTMMGGFNTSVDSLQGSIEALMTSALMPLMNEVLTPFINDTLIPVVNQVNEWVKANPEATRTLLGIAGALLVAGPLLMMVGGAITTISTIVRVAATGVGLLTAAMNAGIAPILAIGAAIAGVIIQLNEFNRLVGTQSTYAGQQLAPQIQSGAISRQDIADQVFRDMQSQFGDLGARLIFGSGLLNIEGQIDNTYNTGMNFNTSGAGGGGQGVTINGPVNVYSNDPNSFSQQLQERNRRY